MLLWEKKLGLSASFQVVCNEKALLSSSATRRQPRVKRGRAELCETKSPAAPPVTCVHVCTRTQTHACLCYGLCKVASVCSEGGTVRSGARTAPWSQTPSCRPMCGACPLSACSCDCVMPR